jgi:HK97 family phage major capsid protein
MPKAYRNGEFVMAQGTFDGYIDGMEDKNGQPIGRVNYGIENGETYRFGGKNVMTVEDDIIAPYDTASAGDVVAVFVDWSKYAMNSNLEFKTVKWEDHDTNEIKNKVILVCDGKLLDPHGVLIIKKAD